ncbi:MAG: hypothetical protein JST89_00010 [Cyanobacteria bacterium SZAS-4]|nr:hypothetical protein [Cyanobacteria bacterium SZAS-4]
MPRSEIVDDLEFVPIHSIRSKMGKLACTVVNNLSRDFGQSGQSSASALTDALLDEGPLHGQIRSIQSIEDGDLIDGYYQRDPACTYSPPEGGRYALYRWRSSVKKEQL